MRIYDIQNQSGQVFAFEIDNVLSRQALVKFVCSIPGAVLLRGPKWFSWLREETFCEFSVTGQKFVIWEPFGDNSRYWVGPKPEVFSSQIALVRQCFADA